MGNVARRPRVRLSWLITAARPHFLAFDIDDEHHTARGIIQTKLGPALLTTLSFERDVESFRIELRLGVDRKPAEATLRAWLRVNERAGLVHLWWDREAGSIWLRGTTYCGRLDARAAGALTALTGCMFRALQDERVQAVIQAAARDNERGAR